MSTYIYATIPEDGSEPRYYELTQSMKDAAYTHHPETGEKIRRVITGGSGFTAGALTKIDPFSSKQFSDITGSQKGTFGDMVDRSKEWSQMRAAKNGGKDPVGEKWYADWTKKNHGAIHPHKKKEQTNAALKKMGIRITDD